MKIHSCACCWARRKPNPGLEGQGPSARRGFMQIVDGKFIQITRLLGPGPLSQQRTQALPPPWVTSCRSPPAPEEARRGGTRTNPLGRVPASPSWFQVPSCPPPVHHGKLCSQPTGPRSMSASLAGEGGSLEGEWGLSPLAGMTDSKHGFQAVIQGSGRWALALDPQSLGTVTVPGHTPYSGQNPSLVISTTWL